MVPGRRSRTCVRYPPQSDHCLGAGACSRVSDWNARCCFVRPARGRRARSCPGRALARRSPRSGGRQMLAGLDLSREGCSGRGPPSMAGDGSIEGWAHRLRGLLTEATRAALKQSQVIDRPRRADGPSTAAHRDLPAQRRRQTVHHRDAAGRPDARLDLQHRSRPARRPAPEAVDRGGRAATAQSAPILRTPPAHRGGRQAMGRTDVPRCFGTACSSCSPSTTNRAG